MLSKVKLKKFEERLHLKDVLKRKTLEEELARIQVSELYLAMARTIDNDKLVNEVKKQLQECILPEIFHSFKDYDGYLLTALLRSVIKCMQGKI